MTKEIFISAIGQEIQAAIVDQEKLLHFFTENLQEKSLVGNIYVGTIVRVLPGMQAAFVEINIARTGFLHIRDIATQQPDAKIEKLVHQGQKIIVQVLKDPLGAKGARLTTEIAFPSTYLVYRPHEQHSALSQKIEDPAERERLSALLAQLPLKGLIARTAAEGQSLEALANDCDYLSQCWLMVQKRLQEMNTPGLLFEELDLPLRTIRDFVKYPIKKIFIDNSEIYEKIQVFVKNFLPALSCPIEYHDSEEALFERYDLLEQFKTSLKAEVALKSGGSIVIEQTESMITIDVNTSRFVGKRSHQETVLKTNLEAAVLIAHQIQLRGLGGLIVIDFIDMDEEEDRLAIYNTLKASLKDDIMPSHILPMSELGLIQMTRKRTTESFQQKYFTKCPSCRGEGQIIDSHVVALEAFVKLIVLSRKKPNHCFVIVAMSSVIEALALKIRTYFLEHPAYVFDYRLRTDDAMHSDQVEIIPLKPQEL